jgi:DNA (cytosine-5)-methyltransferase 1
MVIDAVHFVPQSRPRLFVIGICDNMPVAARKITTDCGSTLWHPRGLLNAYEKLPRIVKDKWLWWSPAPPPLRTVKFSDLIEDDPCDVEWHSGSETEKLLRMMSTINRDKLNEAKAWRMPIVGAVYKRTRQDEGGRKLQRAEIRFDGIAGCLRTPAGGSSRQLIMIVDGQSVRSRLISARETARLMGLPDSYELPGNYNEAYHLTGDGVVVPVVRYLAQNIFEPLLAQRHVRSREAA